MINIQANLTTWHANDNHANDNQAMPEIALLHSIPLADGINLYLFGYAINGFNANTNAATHLSHKDNFMKTTKSHATSASYPIELSLQRIPLAEIPLSVLPAASQRVARYFEQLRTPEEQRICDMATD